MLGPSYAQAERVHERFQEASRRLTLATDEESISFWVDEYRVAKHAKTTFRAHNQRSWDYIFNEDRFPTLTAQDKVTLENSVFYQPAMDYASDENDAVLLEMLRAAGIDI